MAESEEAKSLTGGLRSCAAVMGVASETTNGHERTRIFYKPQNTQITLNASPPGRQSAEGFVWIK